MRGRLPYTSEAAPITGVDRNWRKENRDPITPEREKQITIIMMLVMYNFIWLFKVLEKITCLNNKLRLIVIQVTDTRDRHSSYFFYY